MPRSISPNANKASLVKSLFANSAALLGIRLFMPISFFAISILVARLMGVRAFGAFAIIFSYYALFRILSNFGIDSFLMREIPRDESRARLYLDHSLFAGTAFSLIGIVLMNTVLAMAGYSPEIRRAGFFASLALWPDCLNKYAESFFTGMQKSWIALGTVLAKESLKIVLAVGALWLTRDLAAVMAAITVSYYAGLCVNVFAVGRLYPGRVCAPQIRTFMSILSVSGWVALVGGIATLYLSTDVIVLSKLQGESAVGLYNAAGKFIVLAFLFIDSAGTALLPVLAKLYEAAPADFRNLAEAVFRYFMALIFMFIAGIWFFSDFWIIAIFGDRFATSAGILCILIWGVLFMGNSYLVGKMLFVVNAQKYDFIAVAVTAAINAMLCVYATQRWGASGTASATVVSMAFLFLIHAVLLRKRVFRPAAITIWIKPAAAGAVYFFTFLVLCRWNRIAAGILSTACYGAILVIFGIVKRSELNLLTDIFLRRKNLWPQPGRSQS